MSERVRIFTLSEANALLPRLNVILARQMRLLEEIDADVEALKSRGVSPDSEPAEGDDEQVKALKRAMQGRLQAVREGIAEIESTGAVVKDVRRGLLDFHGRREGRTVWLCWQYGEPAVAHWHPLDEGFSARKPLERTSIPPTLN